MPDININVSTALDSKITAKWGTTLAWKKWVKDETRRAILNDELHQIEIDNAAALQASRENAVVLNDTL